MFVGDEVRLEVSFAAAHTRLAALAREGFLRSAAHQAWDSGAARSGRPGPLRPPDQPGLLAVRLLDRPATSESSLLAMRWEAGAPAGVYAALDADVTLARLDQLATMLAVTGVYRPPPRTVTATYKTLVTAAPHDPGAVVRLFVTSLATAIRSPEPFQAPRRFGQ